MTLEKFRTQKNLHMFVRAPHARWTRHVRGRRRWVAAAGRAREWWIVQAPDRQAARKLVRAWPWTAREGEAAVVGHGVRRE